MSPSGESTILVPVDLSGSETPPTPLLDLLGSVDVVLLGYYPVPDQTAPAQIKRDHGSESASRLESIAGTLSTDAREVTEVLVFTHDRSDTIDRVAAEHGCDAVLSPGTVTSVERVLVPLRGEATLDGIVSLVGDLLRDTDASITFFHSAEDADGQGGSSLLDTAVDRLSAAGIDRDRIRTRLSEGDGSPGEIARVGEEFDVLVLGETDPSLRERVLGTTPTRVMDGTDKPVFVVRNTGT